MLATSPGQTFEVSLEADKDKSKKNRPVFIMRVLTCNQWRSLAKMHDDFFVADESDSLAKAFEIIKKCLVGWKNVGVDFDFAVLGDLVSMPQVTELMQLAVGQRPTDDDRKKSDSPSGSGTAQSAKNAGAKNSAKNRRRRPSPC